MSDEPGARQGSLRRTPRVKRELEASTPNENVVKPGGAGGEGGGGGEEGGDPTTAGAGSLVKEKR